MTNGKYDKSDVSIIIPTYNRDKLLAELLESLQPYRGSAEVIVIDDASTDFTREIVSHSFAKYILASGQGQVEAKKIGVQEAKGDIIGFLEDDMRVESDFLNPVITSINEGEQIVQSRVVESSQPVTERWVAGEPEVAIKYKWNYNFVNNLEYVDDYHYIPFTRESGLFVLKELLISIPMHDHNLIGDGWGESLSFSFRARNNGNKIMYNPESIIYHLSATSGGSSDRFSKNKGAEAGSGCTRFNFLKHHNSMYIHTRFFPHLAIPTMIYWTIYSIGRSVYYRDLKCMGYNIPGIISGFLLGLCEKYK